MPAEGKRPVGGRHHLSLEENRKKSAKGCGNQDDAEKGMNAVHPRFNQECHDRKEEHHGDGIPEPEVHGFGREHLLSDGIPVKNETEKHGPAQKARSLGFRPLLHRAHDGDAAHKVKERSKSGGDEEN